MLTILWYSGILVFLKTCGTLVLQKILNSMYIVVLFKQLDHNPGAPPHQAWRRKLNSHANLLTEFRVTFMEAVRMVNIWCLDAFGLYNLLWM